MRRYRRGAICNLNQCNECACMFNCSLHEHGDLQPREDLLGGVSCTAIILPSKISNRCRYFFEIRCVPIWVSDEITQDLNTVIFDQML